MGFLDFTGGVVPEIKVTLGRNVGEYNASLQPSQTIVNSPISGTTKRFTFPNYIGGGGFSGNINRDDVNIFRSSIFSKAVPLNMSGFNPSNRTDYQLMLAIPFGENNISFYAYTTNGYTVRIRASIMQHIIPSFRQNQASNYLSSSFSTEVIIERRLGHFVEPRIFCMSTQYNAIEFIGFGITYEQSSFDDYNPTISPYEVVNLGGVMYPRRVMYEEVGEPEVVPDNPYPPDSTPDSGEYDPDPTEPTGEPDLPDIGVSNIGLINIYKVETGELNGFASELFPSFNLPQPSEEEGLEGIKENIENVVETVGNFATAFVNNGLVNYVMDCHIVPLTPTTSTRENIKVGFKTFSQMAKRVISDYVEFNCGTVNVKRVYSNFLDYVGARIKLYLPFIGFVDVNPSWCMGGSLKVKYHFNLIDGSCIAYLIGTPSLPKNEETIANTVVATFGGNCCVHIPITGLNYSSMISGVVSGVGSLTNSLSSGNLVGAVNDTFATISSKPSVQSSNGYNSGMAFMSYRKPFILVERPVASFSDKYPSECGIPSNVTKQLSDIKGYTEISNIVFSNSGILKEEEDLIRNDLMTGTIF